MSNVCFLPFANSSVHKVSGNNGSGNYIRHFHKFFISKLWDAEADALLSVLPKKRKKGHKNNPPKRKVTYQHVSAWTNEKKKEVASQVPAKMILKLLFWDEKVK